jgi:microcystin-dependent protein
MTAYIGQLASVAFGFAPKGWALCNGQLLPINQNQPLFSLLGTTYGGDGRTTFGLPDLRGRIALHQGSNNPIGQVLGEEAHTLTTAEMAGHSHNLSGTTQPIGQTGPVGAMTGTFSGQSPYAGSAGSTMANSVTNTGGGQGHENRAPYLAINWIIALQGVFPSRN